MLLVELGWPPEALTPNARVHRFARARAVSAYRLEAGWSATATLRALRIERPQWKRARVNVLAYLGPRRRMPDRDNLVASLKAAFDGLEDAGILADDRGLELGEIVNRGRSERSAIWLAVREISTVPTTAGLSPVVE